MVFYRSFGTNTDGSIPEIYNPTGGDSEFATNTDLDSFGEIANALNQRADFGTWTISELATKGGLATQNTWSNTNTFPTVKFSGDNSEQISAYTGAGSLAGSYSSSNITLDANGKITSISNGSSITTSTYPNTFFVSKGGNDSTGTGSFDKPFLTIQAAINAGEALPITPDPLNPTEVYTIFLYPGTYTEDITFKKGCNLIGQVLKGSDNLNFIVDSSSVIPTFITGVATFTNTSGTQCTNYYVISNLTISRVNTSPLTSSLNNVYFSNCVFKYNIADTNYLLRLRNGGGSISRYVFTNCYFERQNTTSGAEVIISDNYSGSSNVQVYTDYYQCRFNIQGEFSGQVIRCGTVTNYNNCEFTFTKTSGSTSGTFFAPASTGNTNISFNNSLITYSGSGGISSTFRVIKFIDIEALRGSNIAVVNLRGTSFNIAGLANGQLVDSDYLTVAAGPRDININCEASYLSGSTLTSYFSNPLASGGIPVITTDALINDLNMGDNNISNVNNITSTNLTISDTATIETLNVTNLNYNFDNKYPTTLYVSTTGSDVGGDGSYLSPFLTIQKALDVGDLTDAYYYVFIDAGTYDESITIRRGCYLTGIIPVDFDYQNYYPDDFPTIINGGIQINSTNDSEMMSLNFLQFQRFLVEQTNTKISITNCSNCKISYDVANTFLFLSFQKNTTVENSYYFTNCLLERINGQNLLINAQQNASNNTVDFNKCRIRLTGTASTEPLIQQGRRMVFKNCEIDLNYSSIPLPQSFITVVSTSNNCVTTFENCNVNINSVTTGFNMIRFTSSGTNYTATLTNNIFNITGMTEGVNRLIYNGSASLPITVRMSDNYLYNSSIQTTVASAGGAVNRTDMRKTELLNMGDNDITEVNNLYCNNLIPANYYSTSFYVSTEGSDSNNGTFYTPFLTIQKAITEGELLGVEYTIILAEGTYTENIVLTKSCKIVGSAPNAYDRLDYIPSAQGNCIINGSVTINFSTTGQLVGFTYVNINRTLTINTSQGGGVNAEWSQISAGDASPIIVGNNTGTAYLTFYFNDCYLTNSSDYNGSVINFITGNLLTQGEFRNCRFILRSSSSDTANDGFMKFGRRWSIYNCAFTFAGTGIANGLSLIRHLRDTNSSSASDNCYLNDTQIQITATWSGSIIKATSTVDRNCNYYFENSSFRIDNWADNTNYLVYRTTDEGSISVYNRNTALYTNSSIDTNLAISNYTSGSELNQSYYRQLSNIDMAGRDITSANSIKSDEFTGLTATSDVNLNGFTSGVVNFEGDTVLASISATFVPSTFLKIKINGTVYYLQLYQP